MFFFFKQKTAYEMRISDWSSDVCSSDLASSARVPMWSRPRPPRRCSKSRHSPSEEKDMSAVTEIRYVGYAVADLEAERQFYRDKNGRAACRESVCRYV